METILALLMQYPNVAMVIVGLASLVVTAQAYIAFTPTQKDDAWYAKLEANTFVGPVLKALKAFAPIQRKEKK